MMKSVFDLKIFDHITFLFKNITLQVISFPNLAN